MVQFLSINFFSWISSIFVGVFKSSRFFVSPCTKKKSNPAFSIVRHATLCACDVVTRALQQRIHVRGKKRRDKERIACFATHLGLSVNKDEAKNSFFRRATYTTYIYIHIYIVTHFQTVFCHLFLAYCSSGTITYLIPPKPRSFFACLRTETERFLTKIVHFQSKQI